MRQQQESRGIAIEEHFSSPRIRIEENDDEFIVTAFIPGADGKTIEVEQRGNRLRIAAMRKVEKRETADGKRMQASFSSRYQRILTLPGPVRQGGMQTEFSNEVLTIRIPRAPS
jgi:HSP20 family protein